MDFNRWLYKVGELMVSVAFVCVQNSCRSQMAEAWGKELGKEILSVTSAGTHDYHEIKPLAVEVLNEVGLDTSTQYPKMLKDITSRDILITMGCGAECPRIPNYYREDWGLDDPSGGPIEGYRITRDLIKAKVLELISRVESGDLTFIKLKKEK